jgi:hypothetical protein
MISITTRSIASLVEQFNKEGSMELLNNLIDALQTQELQHKLGSQKSITEQEPKFLEPKRKIKLV